MEDNIQGRGYLMGAYNAGPKSALFLRVAEIKVGVIRAILEGENHVFRDIASLACTLSF